MSAETRVRVAGIQMSGTPDRARNIEKAVSLLEMAAERGVSLACLPELFALPWFPSEMDKAHFDLAEPVDGETVTALRAAAAKLDIVIVAPFFEREIEGRFFNSAAVIDAGGELLGVYRKVHVPQIPLWEEKFYFAPGDAGFPVFNTKHLRIGVQICWDNLFPEGSRALALAGAQFVFAPTAAASNSQDLWMRMISANAFANGMYVFRVNRVGAESKQKFYGQSFCVNPFGDLVDQVSGEGEGVVIVEANPRDIEFVRREWPLLRDRRPECYLELAGLHVRPIEEPHDS